MKRSFVLPFALTGLALALSGCGGESANIHEDPNKGVVTTTSGCTSASDKCMPFYVDYPVAGLNFDCSTNTTDHFVTELEGNLATGGCIIGDKVKFYIQGTSTSRMISLGEVDVSKIRAKKIAAEPVPIRLIDIAAAMTGKATTDADTYKVMVALIRIIQANGVNQDDNFAGDIQTTTLTNDIKNNLKNIASNVTVTNLLDGSYINILKPWIDVGSIDEATAQHVADNLIKLGNVNIYTANFLSVATSTVNVGGFQGTGNQGNEAIASLYLITDRAGYSSGYAVQWVGVPVTTGSSTPIVNSSLGRMNLITQVSPIKLDADVQQTWMNPLNKKVEKPFLLRKADNLAENLSIYQGILINDTTIVSTEYMYKTLSGDTKAPDANVYGKWNQTLNGEKFTGGIDVYKTNPASFLNKEVFKTINNVRTGQKYIFPLYADLTFTFYGTEPKPTPVTLGIVVDENGDIRTNMTSPSDLKSSQCNSVDTSMKDSVTGVQQYRIGTTGAANYDTNDKSLTLRMILANPVFGTLDGVLVGLNQSLMYYPQADSTTGEFPAYTSGGVRLNLQNLLVDNSTSRGINITGWNGSSVIAAEWGNMIAITQGMYNLANKDKVTAEQKNLASRASGTISVKLSDCYAIKTK